MSSSVPSPRRRLIRYLIARDKILVRQNSLGQIDVDPELLVDLVATDAPEIVFLRIKKQSLQQERAHSPPLADRQGAVGGKYP